MSISHECLGIMEASQKTLAAICINQYAINANNHCIDIKKTLDQRYNMLIL